MDVWNHLKRQEIKGHHAKITGRKAKPGMDKSGLTASVTGRNNE